MANELTKPLWSRSSPPDCVVQYQNCFDGEFDVSALASDFPYAGSSSVRFRAASKESDRSGFDGFQGRGIGCWRLVREGIINNLTADLLAAAFCLNGKTYSEKSPSGMFHASGNDLWVELLDGGIGVEVLIGEDERTNRVYARQRTTIRGAKCFRALLMYLGFDWVGRKLPGEILAPRREEVADWICQNQQSVGFGNSLAASPTP